jgi:arylsulfatase A-like enzyme
MKSILFLLIFATVFLYSKKPNIILILTDDQGYGDIQAHGHPFLKTPNINQLRTEGVSFDNFYVSPSCSPTRAALLTGMHEFHNGVTHTIVPRQQLHQDAIILPQLLKTAGYKTGFIGKWHLGNKPGPEQRGFDWCSTNQGGPLKHFDATFIRNRKRINTTGYREDIFFDEAINFINEAGSDPFFCYLATYSPHTPLDAPESFIKPFREAGLKEPHATYLAMIENIDFNLGRLMKFLRETERDQDTIIVMINDNGVTEGLDIYNANMRGPKCSAWEGGTRAFSFWRWPGKWRPKIMHNLTAHLDVLPTLCQLAEAKIPKNLESKLEGYSLIPLLESKKKIKAWNQNRILYHHVARWPSGFADQHKYTMAGVRQGNYLMLRSNHCGNIDCLKHMSQCMALKAIENGRTVHTYANGTAQFHWGLSPRDRWALYDVKIDPGCRNDLHYEKQDLIDHLSQKYEGWWTTVYPSMIKAGGDLGNPEQGRQSSKRDKNWKKSKERPDK